MGIDMNTNIADKTFMQSVLKFDYAYSIENKDISHITGLGQSMQIPRHLNELSYTVSQPEVLNPVNGSYPILMYDALSHPAAIAAEGTYRTFIMGFPFESISSEKARANIMASILHFLLNLK